MYLPLTRPRQPALLRRARGLRRAEAADRVDEVGDRARPRRAARPARRAALGWRAAPPPHRDRARAPARRSVLLDEPTTGADVRTRAQILALVRSLADDGSAVVYSTHYLHEIEELDADVAFIDRGRIVAAGTPAELVGAARDERARADLRAHPCRTSARVDGAVVDGATRAHPGGRSGRRRGPAAPATSAPHAGALRSIEIVRPSLESVFLARHRPALRPDAEPSTSRRRSRDLAPPPRRHPGARAPARGARPVAGDGAHRVPGHHDGVPEAGVPPRAGAGGPPARERRRAGRPRSGDARARSSSCRS